jgi:hypothetical protein
MNTDELARQIQVQLDDADIRTDQCDIVRVYWRGRASFVKERADSSVEVTIELRPAPDSPDFLPNPHIMENAFNELEAATKLVHWLKRIDYTNIDAPSEWQS